MRIINENGVVFKKKCILPYADSLDIRMQEYIVREVKGIHMHPTHIISPSEPFLTIYEE